MCDCPICADVGTTSAWGADFFGALAVAFLLCSVVVLALCCRVVGVTQRLVESAPSARELHGVSVVRNQREGGMRGSPRQKKDLHTATESPATPQPGPVVMMINNVVLRQVHSS